MIRIGIVAGEASADFLGANLLAALREKQPGLLVEGIGGGKMQALGCRSLFPADRLAVMGIVEVLGRYRELLDIRRQLRNYYLANPPDLFIGIDAPDFNLGLERSLRRQGIPTVHYVSPSVWAWRNYRMHKIAASVDLMLTLFPFETGIYKEYNIRAEFVGHPLAETIAMHPDRQAARRRLDLDQEETIIAIMPGSRKSELTRLWGPFLQTADLCYRHSPGLRFISNLVNRQSLNYCEQSRRELALDHLPIRFYENRTHDVLEAADLVLAASGTVTLEAMLFKRPMVVAYKLNPVSHVLVKLLAHVNYAALPNLLAGRELVPECLQYDCHPEKLFVKLQEWLTSPDKIKLYEEECRRLHGLLKTGKDNPAANAVLKLLAGK